MKIGIVGARDFKNLQLVRDYVNLLPNFCIVSGGAKGVDSTAIDQAKKNKCPYIEFLPDISNCKTGHEFTKKYYERNKKIVDEVDVLVAFTDKQTGGTWDTIRRAANKGIPVKIFESSSEFDEYAAVFEQQQELF
ncbi:MAG: DUF2493 domain-containing protein [bacterium]|nr:DUF2493 domain-containing protein [bacterium]